MCAVFGRVASERGDGGEMGGGVIPQTDRCDAREKRKHARCLAEEFREEDEGKKKQRLDRQRTTTQELHSQTDLPISTRAYR